MKEGPTDESNDQMTREHVDGLGRSQAKEGNVIKLPKTRSWRHIRHLDPAGLSKGNPPLRGSIPYS